MVAAGAPATFAKAHCGSCVSLTALERDEAAFRTLDEVADAGCGRSFYRKAAEGNRIHYRLLSVVAAVGWRRAAPSRLVSGLPTHCRGSVQTRLEMFELITH